MARDIFYIMAVHIIQRDGVLYYHVTTNAATSEFCPALGRMLPEMVIKWLEKYQDHMVQLAPGVSAVYKQLS